MSYRNRLLNLLTAPKAVKESDFINHESPEMIFAKLPRLHTKRLLLRSLTMRDADDLFAYSKDPLVAQYVLWDAHQTIAQSRSYLRSVIRQYRAGEPSSYAIVLKKSDKLIGTIGFMWFNSENHSAEIGYSLARDQWNQGYMTEALTAVIEFGFRTLKLNRIEAQHDVRNPASGTVMKHCGMMSEGILRQRLYSKGAYVSVELYAILASDYDRISGVRR